MDLLHKQEHFSCFNYEKGQNAQLEILKRPAGMIFERNLVDTEIVFPMKGRFRLSYGAFIREEIDKGNIMLFPPGSHIKVEALEDVHLIICRLRDVVQLCECISLERLYDEFGVTKGFHMLEMNERIYTYIDLFVNCVNDGLQCSYYFATKMRELFFMLRGYYTKEQLAAFFSPMLGKDAQFMNLMYKSYRQVKSVQELAEISNYSLSGFKKQFQRVFGTSASEWMSAQKATRVFQDLNNSPLSIKELAERHNFASVSAFSTFCQNKFGMPPGKIRLNIEKIEQERLKVAKV
ncbi:AraC family transcriptional regulator [Parabacteroides sp. 52]|uniref:helix-turn-helix transcriptional regulator n=1 Tax=unclassified Parabacteroides TaxID=2649774 RepID=UPI0013D69A8F|nr:MULTISPECIES: helix-turn-helix transcriptional regulator [unclassified Parabacteroides]MDH6533852.1 AraC-like DNA-binding protein [Parabacteroides sp. PM5-20]NDV54598.1 AraC family transcriptional regulator [Parabacteroides sp. 52]